MLLTGEVYRAVRATIVARKHSKLQKIRIQVPSTVPGSGFRACSLTAENTRRESGGYDGSTATTRFDLTSITGGNFR